MNNHYSKIEPALYVISTPIGNMQDISNRSLKMLSLSDYILCEDTRITSKLLNFYNIKKKLISFNVVNEKQKIHKILEDLKNQKVISLVSDAGTPAISDPGSNLISKCYEIGVQVRPIPGASAILSAVSVSGFSDNFYFCGFLPKKQTELEKFLAKTKLVRASLAFFMPARDLGKNSKFLIKYFPKSNFLIAREMTKVHETYIKDTIVNINKYIQDNDKGEMTLVIDNSIEEKTDINIDKEIKLLIGKMTSKNIAQYLSKKLEISKKIIYQKVIDLND
jgi:16S rRNA (cytidine1402-2'-O)-methyltransferase